MDRETAWMTKNKGTRTKQAGCCLNPWRFAECELAYALYIFLEWFMPSFDFEDCSLSLSSSLFLAYRFIRSARFLLSRTKCFWLKVYCTCMTPGLFKYISNEAWSRIRNKKISTLGNRSIENSLNMWEHFLEKNLFSLNLAINTSNNVKRLTLSK